MLGLLSQLTMSHRRFCVCDKGGISVHGGTAAESPADPTGHSRAAVRGAHVMDQEAEVQVLWPSIR